jgi:hypothetical protein
MPSSCVDRIAALLRDRSIASGDQILLKQALNADMPSGVKGYLLAEVVSFLEGDLRHMPQFGRLHPDAPGIAHLRMAFLRSLAGAYELPREEFLDLLHEAVAFTESYLTRPQWTLDSFLFEEEEKIDLETMHRRLEYCTDYAYFGRILDKLLARRGATQVGREDFRTLLAHIDDRVITEHSPREFAMLAKPLFDFLLVKDAGPDDVIPLEPVLMFLDDKKLKVIKEYVQSICRLRNTQDISLNQFRQLLEDLESAREGDTAEQKIPEEQLPKRPLQESAKTNEVVPDEKPADAEPAPEIALPDLRNLIGEKQRQKFIRHVFNKDQAFYFGVIATLNTLHTWDEAAAYLKQVYTINRLDPFSGVVVEFTDLVQQRFSGEAEHTG